mmetsp:Transcript_12505/g.24924  ORF Transcript_12505/g.24924 Transcript_12505/m.24924 type:complete len:254 (-) Transcript_12505:270-1031(-)
MLPARSRSWISGHVVRVAQPDPVPRIQGLPRALSRPAGIRGHRPSPWPRPLPNGGAVRGSARPPRPRRRGAGGVRRTRLGGDAGLEPERAPPGAGGGGGGRVHPVLRAGPGAESVDGPAEGGGGSALRLPAVFPLGRRRRGVRAGSRARAGHHDPGHGGAGSAGVGRGRGAGEETAHGPQEPAKPRSKREGPAVSDGDALCARSLVLRLAVRAERLPRSDGMVSKRGGKLEVELQNGREKNEQGRPDGYDGKR